MRLEEKMNEGKKIAEETIDETQISSSSSKPEPETMDKPSFSGNKYE